MAGTIHRHPIYDDDPHFIINPLTRTISYEESVQLPVLVQGDHNSEVYTFEIPRYIDRHDMMLCDVTQIHYLNIEANNKMNRNSGIYEIQDLQVSPDDENVCVFSWTISANATAFVGSLSFAVRFACSEASKFVYVLNTKPFDSIPISTTLSNSDVVVEQHADILEQWYWEFVHASLHGVEAIELAEQKALAKISQVGGIMVSPTEPTSDDAVAWLDTDNDILRIRKSDGTWDGLESIKGEPGSIENAVSELGTSEELVVTQKKITEEINRIDTAINDNFNNYQSNLSRVENDIQTAIAKNTEQDAKITDNFNNYQSNLSRVENDIQTAIAKNTEQDAKITAIESKNTEQDVKITAIESKNTEQDTEIAKKIDKVSSAIEDQLVAFTAEGGIKPLSNSSLLSIYTTVSAGNGNLGSNGETDYIPDIICDGMEPYVAIAIIIPPGDAPASRGSVIIPRNPADDGTVQTLHYYSPISNTTATTYFRWYYSSDYNEWCLGRQASSAAHALNESGYTYRWLIIGIKR